MLLLLLPFASIENHTYPEEETRFHVKGLVLMASPLQNSNFNAFSDCLSAAILQRSAAAPSKVTKKQSRRRRKDTTTSLAREEETERDGEKGAETMEEFVLVRLLFALFRE